MNNLFSDELNTMIEELKQNSVIGVDLEAHSYRYI